MPTEFDQFWACVPRKANKGLARKTFEKLKKKGILPDLQTLKTTITLQGKVYRSKPSFKVDGWTYFPHPSSWLNGERWADEVEVKKAVSHAAPVEGKYGDIG